MPSGPSRLLQMSGSHSFLWLSNIPVCVCAYHIFFIQSSVLGHLGHFHILAIINNAAVYIGMHASFQMSVVVFFRYVPRSRTDGSYRSSINFFWGTSILCSRVATPIYISANSVLGFSFLCRLTTSYYLCPCDSSCYTVCEVTYACGSGLCLVALLTLSEVELLSCTSDLLCVFFRKMSIQIQYLNWIIFLLLSCMSSLYILDINPYWVWFANIFFHSVGCHSFCWWFPLLCRSFLV